MDDIHRGMVKTATSQMATNQNGYRSK